MLQQAQTRSERVRDKTLERLLTNRKLNDAEETLALVAPHEALRSLTTLVAVSTTRRRWYRLVANTLFGGFLGALGLYALFGGDLLSLSGFLIDFAVLTVLALLAYRVTLVRKMVNQYPWRYERVSLFNYRERVGQA